MSPNPVIETTQEDPYERLLSEMPRIAEAVNAFTSEAVQKSAFDALVSAIGATVAPVLHSIKPDITQESDATTNRDEPKGRRRRSGKAAKKTYNPTKGLNFAPAGKPTLAEFIADKEPRNQHERNLVACHYLDEMVGIENVDTNHVLAVYRQAGWKMPADPDNSLHSTYSKMRWIDTEDMSSIKVLWAGTNHVETSMPEASAKKAAA